MQESFKFERGQIAERAMDSLRVIEGFDIVKEHGLGLGAIFGNAILEALGFKRSKKTFHRRVIVAVSLAAHTGSDAVEVERLAEALGGVLHPAIRMMYAGADQLETARWKASSTSGVANESSSFQPAIRFEHRSISAARKSQPSSKVG